ncbi:hypothetical protein A2U01_0118908, partial [Trifolium medium]|nr:hypothetical protein [Trifolium medium]
ARSPCPERRNARPKLRNAPETECVVLCCATRDLKLRNARHEAAQRAGTRLCTH